MKRLLSLIMSTLLFSVPVFSKTVSVKLGDQSKLSNVLEKMKINGYEIDTIVIKGYLAESEYATLRDYINNGKLRGVDLSAVENMVSVPENAFSTTKANAAPGKVRGAAGETLVTKLEMVRLPSTVRGISRRAFFMTTLRSIELPKLSYIGSEAFSGCSELKSVTFHQMDTPYVVDGHAFDNIPAGATLNVPAGAAEAYRNAADFSRFSDIKEDGKLFVTKEFNLSESSQPLEQQIGESMLKVDSIRITGCLAHSDVKALRVNACYGRLSGIDLSGCRIEGDKLPSSAFLSIDDEPYSPTESYLMGLAYNLRYLRLPEGLKTIGGNALRSVNLLGFNMPSTVENIDDGAFQYATLGGDLVIPEGVTHLPFQAFDDTRVEGNIYLPSTLANVDTYGLGIKVDKNNRTKEKNYYYNRMIPPVRKEGANDYYPLGDFDPIKNATGWTLYVPVGAKAAFAADEHWGKFPNIVETPELDGGTSAIGGVRTADAAADKEQRIYTLDGRYVGKDMDRLGKGVYVVGGKKIVR